MLVKLNEDQLASLSRFFSPDNNDGEPQPVDEPFEIIVQRNRIVINGNHLLSDGTWESVSTITRSKEIK